MFHVEQSHIEKAAPYIRPTGKKGLRVRSNPEQRQCSSQLRPLRNVTTVQSRLEPSFPLADAQCRYRTRSRVPDPANDRPPIRPFSHQRFGFLVPERPASSGKVYRLQHSGLSGPVWTNNGIESWTRLDLQLTKQTQVCDLYRFDMHRPLGVLLIQDAALRCGVTESLRKNRRLFPGEAIHVPATIIRKNPAGSGLTGDAGEQACAEKEILRHSRLEKHCPRWAPGSVPRSRR